MKKSCDAISSRLKIILTPLYRGMREFESSKLTIRLLYHATTAQVKTWLLRYCHLDSMKSTKQKGSTKAIVSYHLHIVLAQPTLHKIRRDFETRRHLPFLSYLYC